MANGYLRPRETRHHYYLWLMTVVRYEFIIFFLGNGAAESIRNVCGIGQWSSLSVIVSNGLPANGLKWARNYGQCGHRVLQGHQSGARESGDPVA